MQPSTTINLWSEQLIQTGQSPADSPHLLILHRFWKPESDCLMGEEVAAAWFVFSTMAVQLRLPLSLRLLIDFLARHRWLAQSAAQIEMAMKRDPFYARHATNVWPSKRQTRRFSRSVVKTYIARLRYALDQAFAEAGADLKAADIVISKPSVGNEVGYQLKATVKWIHVP